MKCQVLYKSNLKTRANPEAQKRHNRTHKPQCLRQENLKKPKIFLQLLQISTGSPKALILHSSLKNQKRLLYEQSSL